MLDYFVSMIFALIIIWNVLWFLYLFFNWEDFVWDFKEKGLAVKHIVAVLTATPSFMVVFLTVSFSKAVRAVCKPAFWNKVIIKRRGK